MDTLKEKMLPPKLNLEMVAVELGLAHLSYPSQLETILHHQREGRIAFKCDVPINCNSQEVICGLEAEHDADGNLVILSCGESVWIKTNGEAITLGPAHRTGHSVITVSSFTLDETEYYPLDETGMHPISLSYTTDFIYVDKADLYAFLNKGVEEIPAYADPASEHFAPELALAVRLHRALRVENKENPHWNMEDRVDLWLRKNTPNGASSDSQVKRLKAVIGDGKKIYLDPNFKNKTTS